MIRERAEADKAKKIETIEALNDEIVQKDQQINKLNERMDRWRRDKKFLIPHNM